MKASQIAFFVTFLAVYLLGNAYVFYRLRRLLPDGTGWNIGIILLGAVLVGSWFASMFLRNTELTSLIAFSYRLGSAWFFILLYLLMILLVADMFRLVKVLPVELFHNNPVSLGVVVLLIALIFIPANIHYHNKKKIELNIEIDKPLARPIKIVAVSDLHLGYNIGNRELARWIELINAEQPDIVLVGGDIIDMSVRPLRDNRMAELFRRIDAPYGIVAVYGNHEYISGREESELFYDEAGIRLLRDKAILVDSLFYVVGRDDRTNAHRQTLAELTAELDPDKPILLLDHQPYELVEAEREGIDFQFSGHTHRGQVFPVNLITDAIYERSRGYLQKGTTHYFVSSGLGIWGGKFRIGSDSEYVVINLKAI